jgi:hypothetical protein
MHPNAKRETTRPERPRCLYCIADDRARYVVNTGTPVAIPAGLGRPALK